MATVDKIDDWRMQYDSIDELWNQARIRNFHTDVTFQIGEGGKTPVYSAHKNVLAFSSPVFERMFYGPVVINGAIVIKDVETEVFEAFLSYVYGQEMRTPSICFAAKVYEVADKYSVHVLKEVIRKHVSRTEMNETQFWQLTLEKKYLSPVIKLKYLDYLYTNCSKICNDPKFKRMSSDLVKRIVESPEVNIKEYDLLWEVIQWTMHNIKPGEKFEDRLEPYLCFIRFSSISAKQFCKFLDFYPGLIENDDAIAILRCILYPARDKLPSWCCATGRGQFS